MAKDWKEKLLVVSQTPEFKAVLKKAPVSSTTAKTSQRSLRKGAAVVAAKSKDVHAETAQKLFNLPSTAKISQEQRNAAKFVNYSSLYGDKKAVQKAVANTSTSATQSKKKPTKAEEVLSKINSAGKSASALSVLHSVRNVEVKERLADVRGLCNDVHAIIVEQSSKTKGLVPTRRLAETAINYVTSVKSGLASHDITDSMLPEISKTLRTHLRALKTSVESTLAPPKVQPTFEQLDARSIEVFKLAEAVFKRDVGKNSTKPAFVSDIPVVPIFDGVVLPSRLAAAGLPVGELGGYPVMLRQRVICINTAVADKLKYDRETYLTKLIERIEEHSSQKWNLVTTSGMANKKHELMMYWIMPQKALDSMTDAAGASLRQWGLAF